MELSLPSMRSSIVGQGEVADIPQSVRDVVSDEYGHDAPRILDALDNAGLILRKGSFLPLQAMSFAHSVRTAADALFDRSSHRPFLSMRGAVDRLAEAVDLFDSQRALGVAEQDLIDALRRRIDGVLESRISGGRAAQAYRYIFARRMGAVGPILDLKLDDLVALRDRAASALHTEMTLSEALVMWSELVALLAALFSSPVDRVRALDELALLEHPTLADLAQVDVLALTPVHTRQFLRALKSTEWMHLMTEARWLTAPMVEEWGLLSDINFAFRHEAAAAASFSAEVLVLLGPPSERLSVAVAIASMELGAEAAKVVVPLLKKFPSAIARVAVRWASSLDASSPSILDVADVVLNEGIFDRGSSVKSVLDAMASGIRGDNALARLQLLEWKLRKYPDRAISRILYFESDVSILERPGASRRTVPEAILDCYVRSLFPAEREVGAVNVLSSISGLPHDIRARVRAAFAANSTTLDATERLEILVNYVQEDLPNVDGFRLLDAILKADSADHVSLLAGAFGDPPESEAVRRQIESGDFSAANWRVSQWSKILPRGVLASWTDVLDEMSSHVRPQSREWWESQAEARPRGAGTVFSPADLSVGDVLDVCATLREWRASETQWPSGPIEVGQALTKAVALDPGRWAKPSISVVFETLEHPTYVAAVIEGLKSNETDWVIQPEQLMEICDYVWARKGTVAEKIGARGDRDYVQKWDEVRRPTIDLIQIYANASEYDFRPAIAGAWACVVDLAQDWTLGDRPHSDGDALHRALSRDSTTAFLAAFAIMGAEFRADGGLSPERTQLLDASLRVAYPDGSEYRCLVATHHRFIRDVAPAWWEGAVDRLLNDGTAAARDAFDMMLAWSTPYHELFERYPGKVRDAVIRKVDRAEEQMITAAVNGAEGFAPKGVVDFLLKGPNPKDLGERIASVIEGELNPSEEMMERVFALWDAAIGSGTAAELISFGRLALVESIPDELWLAHFDRTLEVTAGKVSYASDVAERVEAFAPTPQTLHVLDQLIRSANQDWDYYGVDELAVAHLQRARDLTATAEYRSLRSALLERGSKLSDDAC